jgi:phosphatidylserine/phosphatidylglycerophosphate/cardiolipin synthase-like enzyme
MARNNVETWRVNTGQLGSMRRSPVEQARGDVDEAAAEGEEVELLFTTGPHMIAMVAMALADIKESFDGMQYLLDHTTSCLKLAILAGQGIRGRICLDRDNFYNSAAARQCARVMELYEAGVELRTIKPPGSGFASQHTKCWIFDGRVVVDGSCNFTHGGFENNVEHLYRITNPVVVQQVADHFEQVWQMATPVGDVEIKKMKETWDKREAAKEAAKQQKRVTRSCSRSLERGPPYREGSGVAAAEEGESQE